MTGTQTCPVCRGAGEVETGEVDHETNAPLHEECYLCSGSGEIHEETW